MKRASYRHAVELIAANDSPDDFDLQSIAGYVSVGLIAELFGVGTEKVATDVQRFREDVTKQIAEEVDRTQMGYVVPSPVRGSTRGTSLHRKRQAQTERSVQMFDKLFTIPRR